MATKHLVLEILEQNRDKNMSGEYIAELLNISRNMIWRAIKDLRIDGYEIISSTKTGYRLTDENDMLSVEGITPYLASSKLAKNITIFSEIDSTNREAKSKAINNATHGTVIIPNYQTAGKGRYDRNFFSPPNSGLYMSFILYANEIKFSDPTIITVYAALSVYEAIENICNLRPSIKWVNDIFLNGKKIGGILTEGITVFENRSIGAIILGIGINVSIKPEDFPEELRSYATSLYPDGNPQIKRNRLAAEIINRILVSDIPEEAELFEQYKKQMFMLGANVTVVQGNEKYEAKALDVDENGFLVVQTKDGNIRKISSCEVTFY